MPHVRHLIGDQGVTFTNTFSPQPLCCPARASFLTGEYSHNHHVWSHAPPYGFQALHDGSTLPVWLNSAGYDTSFLGKYLNGYGVQPLRTGEPSLRYVPPGWTDWRGSVDGGIAAGSALDGGTYRYFDTTLNDNGRLTPHQGVYQTSLLGRLTRDELRTQVRSPRPFFTWVSYVAPHHGGPAEADDPAPVLRSDGTTQVFQNPARPERVWGRFDAEIQAGPRLRGRGRRPRQAVLHPRPAAADPGRAGRRPRGRPAARRGALARRRPGRPHDPDAARDRPARQHLRGVHLRQRLLPRGAPDAAGQDPPLRAVAAGAADDPRTGHPRGPGPLRPVHDDRLRADDPGGGRDPGPRLRRRREPARGGPLRRPGLGPRHPHRDRPARGRPRTPRRATTSSSAGPGPSPLRFSQGVRTGDYLYVEHASRERELYDLRRDPREVTNLVDRPGSRRVVRAMAHELDVLRNCVGVDCRRPLPPLLRTSCAGRRRWPSGRPTDPHRP